MVATFFLPTLPTDVTQERVGTPSNRTVQAPPSPQPYCCLSGQIIAQDTEQAALAVHGDPDLFRSFSCVTLDIGSLSTRQ
jgi:hypothetical protein